MHKHRLILMLLSIPLLFLLLFGGTALYYLFANPTTARVSIQPESKYVQNTATITVVTAHPDPTQQQIAGARLLSFTSTHTLTQTATGQGYAQATSASGTMEMTAYVPTYGTATISAGTRLTGYDGITIVADQREKRFRCPGDSPTAGTYSTCDDRNNLWFLALEYSANG